MESKIKVGDYIRTYDGIIGKVLEEDDIGQNIVSIDTIFFDDYADETGLVKYESIKKYSANIIDLIEKGDIIVYTLNKMTVPKLTRVNIYKEARTFNEYLGAGGYKLDRVDILSIATHEQFRNIEYII